MKGAGSTEQRARRWLLVAVGAVVLLAGGALGQEGGDSPGAGASAPARFQIVAAQMINRNGQAVPVIIRIDTATGKAWQLVEYGLARNEKQIARQGETGWKVLPEPEVLRNNIQLRMEERARQLENARNIKIWCQHNRNGGTLQINGEKVTFTKEEVAAKLRDAEARIAALLEELGGS